MTGAAQGFHVTALDRTDDGRDVMLTRSFDGDRISLGRGGDNDVRVPDLAVSLQHAVIRRSGADRLIIQSSPGDPFELDGRRRTRAEIGVRGESVLRLGHHAIVIRGTADGGVAISVNGPGAVSGAAGGQETDAAFDLGWVLPERRLVAIFLALLTFVVCAWPILRAQGG